MEINWTLIGQTIEFVLFVFFCMKFIWPPIIKAIEERQKTITEGLEAAEKGKKSLELAQSNAAEQIRETKKKVAQMMDEAVKSREKIIDSAKQEAIEEKNKILQQAKEDITSEYNKAKEKLRLEISSLVVECTQKVIEKNIDDSVTNKIVDDYVSNCKNSEK